MNIDLGGLDFKQLDDKVECQHEFACRQGSNNIRYHICKLFPSIELRY